jgi:hypothetical protein
MTEEVSPPGGPDLPNGLDLAQLADGGMLRGHVGPEAVLLVRAHDVVPLARRYRVGGARRAAAARSDLVIG